VTSDLHECAEINENLLRISQQVKVKSRSAIITMNLSSIDHDGNTFPCWNQRKAFQVHSPAKVMLLFC
jgi:hypothetical protein